MQHTWRGVCYFLADKQRDGKDVQFFYHNRDNVVSESIRQMRLVDEDIMFRDVGQAEVISEIERVDGYIGEDGGITYNRFDSLVSVKKPYGFRADAFYLSREGYLCEDFVETPLEGAYRCIGLGLTESGTKTRCLRWFPNDLDFFSWDNRHKPDTYRVVLPQALFDKNDRFCIEATVAKPGDICTETFMTVGGFGGGYQEAYNVASYMKTKFFRYLLTIYKQDQNISRETFQAIPVQDFSICWTDDMLYKRYNLPQHLIDVIESSIMTDTSPVRCDLTEVSGVSKS